MSTVSTNYVVGVFTDSMKAHQAFQELQAAGFTDAEVGLISSSKGSLPHSPVETVPMESAEKEKVVAEASTGALLGAGVGSIGALTLASLMVPGFGPMFVAGFLGLLASGAIGGAVVGGLTGSLMGLGLPERHAHEIERALLAGCTVVNVHTSERQDEAAAIMDRNGAEHIELPPPPDQEQIATSAHAEDQETSHTHPDLVPEHLYLRDDSASAGGFTVSGGFGGLATAHDGDWHFHLPGVQSHQRK